MVIALFSKRLLILQLITWLIAVRNCTSTHSICQRAWGNDDNSVCNEIDLNGTNVHVCPYRTQKRINIFRFVLSEANEMFCSNKQRIDTAFALHTMYKCIPQSSGNGLEPNEFMFI